MLNEPCVTPSILTHRLLMALLALSLLTNCIFVLRLKYPGIVQKIQHAALPAPKVQADDHMAGRKDARNTIIVYTDFQCPYCIKLHEAMRLVMQSTDDTRWVFRHFPLESHPLAVKAAEAAECASEQGHFWKYSDAVFSLKTALTDQALLNISEDLGLNVTRFNTCLETRRYQSVVAAQHAGGKKQKLDGTPTFFLNGKRYVGAMSAEEILRLLGVQKPVQQTPSGKTIEKVQDADVTTKHKRSSSKNGLTDRVIIKGQQGEVVPSAPIKAGASGIALKAVIPEELQPADSCVESGPASATERSTDFCK